jgi:hypothetical protein
MEIIKAGKYIDVKDANGNDIFIGSVINHNGNLYVIKWSNGRNEIVARKEPLKGQTASWRDLKWINRVSNHIKMVGTILFDDEDLKNRFKDVV